MGPKMWLGQYNSHKQSGSYAAERNPGQSLLMEWNATALLLICKEVLTRNSGQLDANFLQLHNNLMG